MYMLNKISLIQLTNLEMDKLINDTRFTACSTILEI